MFLQNLIQFGGFELNHHWHGIDMLIVLECALLAALLCTTVALLARFWGRTRLKTAAVIAALTFATAAYAANTALSALSASGALAGANLIYVVQTVGVGGVKATMTQVATFINSLFSGDATVASGGAVTLATVNGNVGSFGSATAAPSFTVNAKGLITAAGSNTITPAVGSITGLGTGCATWLATPSSANLRACITDETGTGVAVFGTGPTISSVILSTAAQLSYITGSIQCLHVDASGNITGTGSDCGSGSGGVTSIAGNTGAFTLDGTSGLGNATNAINCKAGSSSQFGCVKVDGTSILASSGIISVAALTVVTSLQTGTNYPFVTGDQAKVIYLSNASDQIPTIPVAGSAGFPANWPVSACNIGAGKQTITPASGTIGGQSSFQLPAGTPFAPKCISFISDGASDYKIYLDGAPLNGINIWTARQTFGEVNGTVTTQSGTTYTFAQTDCGTTVRFTNASAITATIPQGLIIGCNISVLQAGAGQVSVNGSAVTPATLQSAHSYTKTFGQNSMIGLTNDASNHVTLTGDGA